MKQENNEKATEGFRLEIGTGVTFGCLHPVGQLANISSYATFNPSWATPPPGPSAKK